MNRTIKTEFPDYDDVEMDVAPFFPEPWHNDACPRYSWRLEVEGIELSFFTDYKAPALREAPDEPRFTLQSVLDGELVLTLQGETLADFREALNVWYAEQVGYRPDDEGDTGREMPLGELMELVGSYAAASQG